MSGISAIKGNSESLDQAAAIESQAKFQWLCKQVREQQKVVDEVGREFTELI